MYTSHIPPRSIYQSYDVHIHFIDQDLLYVNILFYFIARDTSETKFPLWETTSTEFFEQTFTTVHSLHVISSEHMCVNEKPEVKMTQWTDGRAMMFSAGGVLFFTWEWHIQTSPNQVYCWFQFFFYSNFLYIVILL